MRHSSISYVPLVPVPFLLSVAPTAPPTTAPVTMTAQTTIKIIPGIVLKNGVRLGMGGGAGEAASALTVVVSEKGEGCMTARDGSRRLTS
jgi:CBS domain-containing protein